MPVARLFTIENERYHPGEFRSFTALVPAADLSAVLSLPRGLEHEVSASGPRPWGGAAPTYDPSFWVRAHNLPAKRYEPLILSWRSNDQTVLVPDPRFLMTYGLVPRTLSKGKIAFDDPQAPAFDVVEVDPPSVWDFPKKDIIVGQDLTRSPPRLPDAPGHGFVRGVLCHRHRRARPRKFRSAWRPRKR